MNLHQVLTGAVNPGDNCFSVGSLHGQPFTVSPGGAGRWAPSPLHLRGSRAGGGRHQRAVPGHRT